MKKNHKATFIRVAVSLLAVLMLLFFMKGYIYQMAVKYEDGGGRKNYEVKDEAFAKYINENLPNDEELDKKINIDMIVYFSQEMTAKALDFSEKVTESDPQKTLVGGLANYEGYAAFSAAIANYLAKMYLNGEWEAKPKKGKLYLFGSNKTKGAKDGWFKDHDFVVFRNKNTKEEIYIDPVAYDLYGIKRVDKYIK